MHMVRAVTKDTDSTRRVGVDAEAGMPTPGNRGGGARNMLRIAMRLPCSIGRRHGQADQVSRGPNFKRNHGLHQLDLCLVRRSWSLFAHVKTPQRELHLLEVAADHSRERPAPARRPTRNKNCRNRYRPQGQGLQAYAHRAYRRSRALLVFTQPTHREVRRIAVATEGLRGQKPHLPDA